MAEDNNRDIEQKISINYTTNADAVAKQTDNLADSVDDVAKAEKAAGKATGDLNKKFEEIYGDLQPLTSRLGEAEDRLYELALAGKQATEEYQGLLEIVSNYRRTQIDTDRTVDAAASTIGEKLGGAVSIAATGISGITSGLALFGAESADTEKALLKVQAAMAFADSVSKFTTMGAEITKVRMLVVAAFTSLTAAKTAETIATEANTAATEKGTLSKIKGAVSTVAMSAATGVATAAQWVWNVAVMANPIVALVVGIIAAIAAIYKLTTFLIDSSKANDAAAKATKEATKALADQQKQADKNSKTLKDNNEQLYKLAEASGASSKQLRDLAVKHAEEEVAIAKKNKEIAKSTFLRQKDTLEMLRNAGASDEVIENQKKLTTATFEEYKKQYANQVAAQDNKIKILKANEVEVVREETAARKDREKKQLEHLRKLADDRKKALEEEKSKREAAVKELATIESNYVKFLEDFSDKTERAKLKRAKDRDLENIDRLTKLGLDTAEAIRLNEEKYSLLEKEYYEKRKKEKEEENQKKIDDRRAFDEQYYMGIREFSDAQNEMEIEQVRAHKEALLEIEEENALRKIESDGGTPEEIAEKRLQVQEWFNQQSIENDQLAEDTKLEHKRAIQDQVEALGFKGIAVAKQLFEKDKGVQRGLLIAENAIGLAKVGINTATGISKAMTKGVAGIPEAVIIGATGVLSAVSIVSSTAKGLKALGGGGGGGDTSAAGGGAQRIGAASQPQVDFQSSSENQISSSINQAQQDAPPVQAYVVSQEMTDGQAIERNRIESNSF